MKKHRKTVLAAIMLILVVASAVFAARVHTVSLDAENVAKITAKSTVTQAPPDEIVLTDSQCRELAEKLGSITLYKSFFKYSGWKGWSFMFTVEYSDGREERITLKGARPEFRCKTETKRSITISCADTARMNLKPFGTDNRI